MRSTYPNRRRILLWRTTGARRNRAGTPAAHGRVSASIAGGRTVVGRIRRQLRRDACVTSAPGQVRTSRGVDRLNATVCSAPGETWRGYEFGPGWRRNASSFRRLCGTIGNSPLTSNSALPDEILRRLPGKHLDRCVGARLRRNSRLHDLSKRTSNSNGCGSMTRIARKSRWCGFRR